MSKIGLIVIVSSAAVGATYYSTAGSVVFKFFAMVFFGLAAVTGFLVSLSVLFCMFFLPLLNLTRIVCVRLVLITKRL